MRQQPLTRLDGVAGHVHRRPVRERPARAHGVQARQKAADPFQRVAVVAIGLIFLVGTFHNPGRVGAWVYAGLLFVASAAGAALATRQVWLQALPKDQVPACGMGLSYMIDTLPFVDVIRRVLEGSGECAEKGWVFLGLSIAGWTLAFFVAIAVAGFALVKRD